MALLCLNLGAVAQEKKPTDTTKKSLKRNLQDTTFNLREIDVNAGYYTVKQKYATGNISSVKASEIEKQPVGNLMEAMQGRVTGVYIQQNSGVPGSSMNIQIRGRNSIAASSNPLYIIDNVPFSSQSLTNTLSASINIYGADGANPLQFIAPDDIESIEVLKDADATAIYGSRGANGVVLITTKKGKSGRLNFEVGINGGGTNVTRTMPMLNTDEYLALRKQAFALDNTNPKTTDYDINGTWNQDHYTNWQKTLYAGETYFNQSKIAISGGSAQSTFMLSGTYHKQGSTIKKGMGYDRLSLHYAGSQQSANTKFKVDYSGGYSLDQTNWISENMTSAAMLLAPNAPMLYNEDGSLNWENGTWINPLRNLAKKYEAANRNFLASLSLKYEPLKNLNIKANLGYQYWALKDFNTNPVAYYNPSEGRTPATSFIDQNQSVQYSFIAEPQLSYFLPTAIGDFSVLTGMSFQKQKKDQTIVRATGFTSDELIENIKAAGNIAIRNYEQSTYAYSGLYARINYSYRQKYIVNLTGRRDGSSRFGTDRKFANFGAIGMAYLFSEEKELKEMMPWLSYGKLRASYGSSGNDQIGDYEYLNTYQATNGYNGVGGLSPMRLYNPDFGWEVNKKFEVGMELGFFNNRLELLLSYFRNISDNQLVSYPLASTTGFTSIRSNLNAKVQNTGFELEVKGNWPIGKKVKWESGLNLTIPRNKLLDFPLLANSSYANQYVIGHALDVAKVYHYLGVNAQTGLYQYLDVNGDNVISVAGDATTLIDKGQRLYGGLNNNINIGNFQFSFLLQFVKQKMYTFRALYNNAPGTMNNQPRAFLGQYWTAQGQIADLQRLTTGTNTQALVAQNNFIRSDAAIGDASFIRLKNVAFSYVNHKLLKGCQLKLFMQAQNLYTFTSYFGLDPETANNTLPPMQTYVLGLQLTL